MECESSLFCDLSEKQLLTVADVLNMATLVGELQRLMNQKALRWTWHGFQVCCRVWILS